MAEVAQDFRGKFETPCALQGLPIIRHFNGRGLNDHPLLTFELGSRDIHKEALAEHEGVVVVPIEDGGQSLGGLYFFKNEKAGRTAESSEGIGKPMNPLVCLGPFTD